MKLHEQVHAIESATNLDLPTKIRQITKLYFSSPVDGPEVLTRKEVSLLFLSAEKLATEELLKQRS
jgi:hypothetical protein